MSKKVVKKTQYSLMKPLRGRGNIGDFVYLRPGYGRYLERYGRAIRVTKELMDNLDLKKSEWEEKEKSNIILAKELLKKLEEIKEIQLERKVSQGDKLYASVKKEDIVNFFTLRNIILEKEQVRIDNVIKVLGEHSIIINVYGNEEIEIKVVITKE